VSIYVIKPNPTKQAGQLNGMLHMHNPEILDMLAPAGFRAYFPSDGILAQAKKAGDAATRAVQNGEKFYNATIGTTLDDNGQPLVYQKTRELFEAMEIPLSKGIVYGPSAGLDSLREILRKDARIERLGLPVITHGLTQALSDVAALFIDHETAVVAHSFFWENIQLQFQDVFGATLITYPFFNKARTGFNFEGLAEAMESAHKSGFRKVVVYLNFPNNPTGYNLTDEEGQQLRTTIWDVMRANRKMHTVVITDEAYYGFSYDNATQKTIMSYLVDVHPQALVLGAKGPTKEANVWGLRVGALFVLPYGMNPKTINTLNQKLAGVTRAIISMPCVLSQEMVEQVYLSDMFMQNKKEINAVMARRATAIKDAMTSDPIFAKTMPLLPFNSGYFCSFKVRAAAAVFEKLLERNVGVIAGCENNHPRFGGTEVLRYAFSSVPESGIYRSLEIMADEIRRHESCRRLQPVKGMTSG